MATVFKPRKTQPINTDPNWRHYTKGGFNYCIMTDDTGAVLPNCVGYAWGRWREFLGAFHQLSRANAEDWYNKNDGYARGQTPRLGAVMCWAQGSLYNGADGAGHVAIVEEILADGSVVISNSDWAGSKFYTRTIRPNYSIGSAFKFQGFIYPPVDFVAESKPNEYKPVTAQVIQAVLRGDYGNGAERIKRLEADGYNPAEVQAAVDRELSGGSTKPNPANAVDAVIRGDYGNGADRVKRLEADGYNAAEVQKLVDAKLAAQKPTYKNPEGVVDAVIRGDYGNGADRVTRLKSAGYDPVAVQKLVDARYSSGVNVEMVAKQVRRGDWGNGAERQRLLEEAGWNYRTVMNEVNRQINNNEGM